MTEIIDGAGVADWLRLTLAPGIGGEAQRRLLKAFGLPAAVFAASGSALRAVVSEVQALALSRAAESNQAEIEAALAWAQLPGNHLITLADAAYPQQLLNSADPPILLYAKGRIDLLQNPCVAIVGARSATQQGELNATAFAAALASAGLTVVSGLALGIDAAAHRGALQEKASTIAVIGTGADRIYPVSNQELARRIAAEGVILSEFALGTPPLAANFPRRNRLIAGLARGCLVVEAAERSGSLITARLAAEAGAEVFAIPGSIHSPLSKGCHKLIKQGAKLVDKAADILEELRWGGQESGIRDQESESVEPDAVLAALGHDPCDLDTLAARAQLPADALLARLLNLELDGKVAQLPGGRYQRLQ